MSKSLLDLIADKLHLEDAWRKLNKTNKKSAGYSQITIADFERRLHEHIDEIHGQLIGETFAFGKVKGATIKKKRCKVRPLRIPEIRDRLVLKAISLKLEEILTPVYNLNNDCSFAYQSGKSIKDAIQQMRVYFEEGYKYILEADIKAFFDNVNSTALLEEIKEKLPDNSINGLLDGALQQDLANVVELTNAGVYEVYFKSSELGIPQGNSLSPLLANVYLADFDQRAITEGLKMVRYADDFIIMCKTKEEALRAFEIAKEEIEVKRNLSLYALKDKVDGDEKISRIVDPRQRRFSFLSIRFNGEKCWVEDKKYESFKEKIMAICDKKLLISDAKNVKDVGLLQAMVKLRNLLEGWVAAYHFADIEWQVLEIDKFVNVHLYRLFKSFNFLLEKKRLDRIKFRGKSHKPIGINNHQRKDSGVPFCWDILKRVRVKNSPKKNK